MAFPDRPGLGARGYPVAEARPHAAEALLDYAIDTEKDGDELITPSPRSAIAVGAEKRRVSVPLIRAAAGPEVAGPTGD